MFASVAAFVSSSRIGQFVNNMLRVTPESVYDVIFNLDKAFCDKNNRFYRMPNAFEYKDELLKKLHSLSQGDLDQIYKILTSYQFKVTQTPNEFFSDNYLLDLAIKNRQDILVNLLLTPHNFFLNDNHLSTTLQLADECESPGIISCIVSALAEKLLAGMTVTIQNLSWKKGITNYICNQYDQLLMSLDPAVHDNLSQKAWELIAIAGKAKALLKNEVVPACNNDAFAKFLIPQTSSAYSYFISSFINQEIDDCLDKIDSVAKAILKRTALHTPDRQRTAEKLFFSEKQEQDVTDYAIEPPTSLSSSIRRRPSFASPDSQSKKND